MSRVPNADIPDFTPRPTAQMTDQFVQQQSAEQLAGPAPAALRAPDAPLKGPNQAQQYAEALERYGPLMIYSPKLGLLMKGIQDLANPIIKRNIEGQAMTGKLLVENSQKTFAQLVESGEISESDNPWKVWAAKRASGVIHSDRYNRAVAVSYADWLQKNPDSNEMDIEKFLNEQSGLYLKQHDVRDNTEMSSFFSGRKGVHQNITAQHISHVNKRRTQQLNIAFDVSTQNLAGEGRELAQSMAIAAEFGTGDSDAAALQQRLNTTENEEEKKVIEALLKQRRENAVGVSDYIGKWQKLLDEEAKLYGNKEANRRVFSKLLELQSSPDTRTPALDTVIEQLKTGEGAAAAPYANTEEGKALLARTEAARLKATTTLSTRDIESIKTHVAEHPNKGMDFLLPKLKMLGVDINNSAVRSSVRQEFIKESNAASQFSSVQRNAMEDWASNNRGSRPTYDEWKRLWAPGGELSKSTDATAQQRLLMRGRAQYEAFYREQYPHGTLPYDIQQMLNDGTKYSGITNQDGLNTAYNKHRDQIAAAFDGREVDANGVMHPDLQRAYGALETDYLKRASMLTGVENDKGARDRLLKAETMQISGREYSLAEMSKEFPEAGTSELRTLQSTANKGATGSTPGQLRERATSELEGVVGELIGQLPLGQTPEDSALLINNTLSVFSDKRRENSSKEADRRASAMIEQLKAKKEAGAISEDDYANNIAAIYAETEKIKSHDYMSLGGQLWEVRQEGDMIVATSTDPASHDVIEVPFKPLLEQRHKAKADNAFTLKIDGIQAEAKQAMSDDSLTKEQKALAQTKAATHSPFQVGWFNAALDVYESTGVFPRDIRTWVGQKQASGIVENWGVEGRDTYIKDSEMGAYRQYLSIRDKNPDELTEEDMTFLRQVPNSFRERENQVEEINRRLRFYSEAVKRGRLDSIGMTDDDIALFGDMQFIQAVASNNMGGGAAFTGIADSSISYDQLDRMAPAVRGMSQYAGPTYSNLDNENQINMDGHPANNNTVVPFNIKKVANRNEAAYYTDKFFEYSGPNFDDNTVNTLTAAEFKVFNLGGSGNTDKQWVMLSADADAMLQYSDDGHLAGLLFDPSKYPDKRQMVNVPVSQVMTNANTRMKEDNVGYFWDGEPSFLNGHLVERLMSERGDTQDEARTLLKDGYIAPSRMSKTAYLPGRSPQRFALYNKSGHEVLSIPNETLMEDHLRSTPVYSERIDRADELEAIHFRDEAEKLDPSLKEARLAKEEAAFWTRKDETTWPEITEIIRRIDEGEIDYPEDPPTSLSTAVRTMRQDRSMAPRDSSVYLRGRELQRRAFVRHYLRWLKENR